jgi:hypothetical protein
MCERTRLCTLPVIKSCQPTLFIATQAESGARLVPSQDTAHAATSIVSHEDPACTLATCSASTAHHLSPVRGNFASAAGHLHGICPTSADDPWLQGVPKEVRPADVQQCITGLGQQSR